jgi:aldose 1-epimerase
MAIRVSSWGVVGERAVHLFEMSAGAYLAEVSDYGGTIVRLCVPDRTGRVGNVNLGMRTVEEYRRVKSPFFGCLVGRYANRIGGAKFSIGGREYRLAGNDGGNTLHGGLEGYDKRVWSAADKSAEGNAVLELTLRDPDGCEGFPGNVDVKVTYTLTAAGVFRVDYFAVSDAATPINLTQHAYFNLKDGGKSGIGGHVLKVHASRYTQTDLRLIPTGKILPVAGTVYDFRTEKEIGKDLLKTGTEPAGYDDCFVIDAATNATALSGGKLVQAAEVQEPVTGRTMEVWTTQPGVQLYTGNFLDGSFADFDGQPYRQHAGFCLETQHFADGPNRPEFGVPMLVPGKEYRQATEFRFGVR